MCRSTARFLAVGPGGLYEMAPPGSFKFYVRQATRSLYDAFFNGQISGITSQCVGWRGVNFWGDDTPANDMFDRDYWHVVELTSDESKEERENYQNYEPRVLQVLPGKQPADAIAAIIARPTRWGIDCDYTLQFANLYALCLTLGPEKFNQRIAEAIPPTRDPSKQTMRIRPRYSDGMKTLFHFARDKPADAWKMVLSFDNFKATSDDNDPTVQIDSPFDLGSEVAAASETQELVGSAGAGSRVRLTNLEVPLKDSFRHENCVKLEYDLFAAGGFTDSLTRNEFGIARLFEEFATHKKEGPQVSLENIFIDEIEVFDQG